MLAHRFPSRRRFAAALLASGAVLAACSEPPPPAPVEPVAVFVAPASLELRAGEAAQLTAQSNDANGQAIGGAELEFDSEAPTIADVTREGLVSATGPAGATEIVVASGRAEARVPVVVRPGAAASLAVGVPVPADAPPDGVLEAVVRAVDAFGNPVPGVAMTFTVVAGDGAVEPSNAITDAGGLARARWTVGPGAGEHALSAAATGVAPLKLQTERPEPPSEPEDVDADPEPKDATRAPAAKAARRTAG